MGNYITLDKESIVSHQVIDLHQRRSIRSVAQSGAKNITPKHERLPRQTLGDESEDELNCSAVMLEGSPLKIQLPRGGRKKFSFMAKRSAIDHSRHYQSHHVQRSLQQVQEHLQLTLDSTESIHYDGGRRSRVALETGASIPRQSAFIKNIPYFLSCSNVDEAEECVEIRVVAVEAENDGDIGSSRSSLDSIEDGIINSTLFGEMIMINPGKSGASTPSCFLDSAKFYTRYCEETANRPEAEDLMIQTVISQEKSAFVPSRPSSNDNVDQDEDEDDDDGATNRAQASEESTDSIMLRTD